MNQDQPSTERNVSVSLPLAAVGGLLLMAAAAVAYAFILRGDQEEGSSPRKTIRRKFGLMTAITLIENDATRKLVIAVLRAMARRT